MKVVGEYLDFSDEYQKITEISASNFSSIAGLSSFNPKGDGVLKHFGIYRPAFDSKYQLRGAVAEDLVERKLKQEGKTYVHFNPKTHHWNIFKDDHFKGVPDFEVNNDYYIEVKSKNIKSYDFINEAAKPNLDEIYQAALYTRLSGKDHFQMQWIFFDDALEEAIFNGQKDISSLINSETCKRVVKDYKLSEFDIDYKMQEAVEYLEQALLTKKILISDVSNKLLEYFHFDDVIRERNQQVVEELPF